MRRIIIWIMLALLVLGMVGLRIWIVNSDAPSIPIEEYSINDSVELDGAFLQDKKENTKGYAIKVVGAQLMSYNEYVEQYGQDRSLTEVGLDADSIVVLDIEIENVGNGNGYLFVVDWKLVTEEKNDYLLRDDLLWRLSESSLAVDDEPILNFSIRKDSTYLTHIPFKTNINDELGKTQYKKVLNKGLYVLELTRSPVKKVVNIML